jgi:RNA polymerase sigma-70 factor (ECF subfamily)
VDEKALLAQAKRGNNAAFEVLVRKHQTMVFRTVLRIVRNEDDAMDVTQDSFVRAYTRLHSFRGASSFGTWVCRIAINIALNQMRARKHTVDPEEVHLASPPEDVGALRDREEVSRRLDAAIEELPPRQRLTLLLRVKDGKSHQQIAEILDCAVGTSKASFHNAVRNLRKALGDVVSAVEETHETP